MGVSSVLQPNTVDALGRLSGNTPTTIDLELKRCTNRGDLGYCVLTPTVADSSNQNKLTEMSCFESALHLI